MADWSLPSLTSTYANFRQNLTDRDVDVAIQFQSGTPTNVPTNAIKWDTTLNRWQKWSGTAWGELTTTYALTGLSVTSFNNTGNTTLGDAAADTVTINANTLSYPNGVTISGTISYSGSITYTGNVTFGDAAGDTVTFVANTATVPAGGFTFNGGVVNFAAGVQSGGSAVVSASSTATFTNKTFDTAGAGNVFKVNGNTVTAAAGTATITMPAATDTLVGRATTDTLTNKTLTGAAQGSSMKDDAGTAYELGWRDMPVSSTTSGTLTVAERGKVVPATGAVTINNSVFAAGNSFAVYNNSAAAITITQGTITTMRLAGTATTGSRTVPARGWATVWFLSASECIVGGSGVT